MRHLFLIRAVLVAALLPITHAARAADANGDFSVEGPGALTCRQMVAIPTSSEQFPIIAGYVSGFLAAHNKLLAQTYDVTPWQSLELSVRQIGVFCEANPELRIINALDQYVDFLHDTRITSADERLSLTVNKQTIVLYQSTVDKIREKLAEKQISPDASDPIAGLRLFQEQAGLEQTGLPDQRTLLALFGEAR